MTVCVYFILYMYFRNHSFEEWFHKRNYFLDEAVFYHAVANFKQNNTQLVAVNIFVKPIKFMFYKLS